MLSHSLLSKYAVTETLHEAHGVGLYRAQCDSPGENPVLLRVARKDPAEKAHRSLQRELEIAARFSGRSVLRPSRLESFQDSIVLVHPDFEGDCLRRFCGTPLAIPAFLDVAILLTEAVGELHEQGFIHRSLCPERILLQIERQEVRLLGLGLATHRFTAASHSLLVTDLPLAYAAPEQTGRVGHILDERADLYSLGVIFYELLTGSLPFQAQDPLGWAHCHVACEPLSPERLTPGIPEVLAALVLKLLAKDPHDRYRRAKGLRADLERCRRTLRQGPWLLPFALGEKDGDGQLSFPQRLYGRERERARLCNAQEEVFRGLKPRFVGVWGSAGIGKSSLTLALQDTLLAHQGMFLLARCEPLHRGVPCRVLCALASALLRQVLTQDDVSVERWRTPLAAALGEDAALVSAFVPELQFFLGDFSSSQQDISSYETHSRLARGLGELFRAALGKVSALTLCVDDMQAIDSWSLDVLRSLLLCTEVFPLLVVGTVRSEEVFEAHPLLELEHELRARGVAEPRVELGPLSAGVVGSWLRDVLGGAPQSGDLVEALHVASRGVPLSLQQHLRACEREGIVRFSEYEMQWHWDEKSLSRLRAMGNSSSVFERSLSHFPPDTRRFLEIVACLELPFDPLRIAALLSETGLWDFDHEKALTSALAEGFLVQVDADGGAQVFRFAHEGIRDAVLAALPQERRLAIHRALGFSLARVAQGGDWAPRVAYHLGALPPSSLDVSERLLAAHWCHGAGVQARHAAAFETALAFLSRAVEFLPQDAWETHSSQAYVLERDLAECEFLCARFEDAATRFLNLLDSVADPLKQAEIHNLRMVLLSQKYEFAEAVEAGLAGLRALGMPLFVPGADLPRLLESECAQVEEALTCHGVGSLSSQQRTQEPAVLAALNLLQNMFVPTYNTDAALNALSVARMMNLTFTHGNSPFAPFACMAFAVSDALQGRADRALALGEVALSLDETLGQRDLRARIYHMFGCWVSPWKLPLGRGPNWFSKAYQSGIESGDLVFAGCAIMIQVAYDPLQGLPLAGLLASWEHYGEFLHKTRQERPLATLQVSRQLVRCLRGETRAPDTLEDATFGEEPFLARVRAENLNVAEAWFFLAKTLVAVMADDFSAAIAWARKARPLVDSIAPGTLLGSELEFLEAFAWGRLEASAEGSLVRQRALGKLRGWASACPPNFEAACLIIEAQEAWTSKKSLQSLGLLEKAAERARASGQPHKRAMAFELAARWALQAGLVSLAESSASKARAAFREWGANVKVARLELDFAELLVATQPVLAPVASGTDARLASWSGRPEQLDVHSALKASQALSEEMNFDRLLLRLVMIALENSGARRGLLLLGDGPDPVVEMEGLVGNAGLEVRPVRKPLSECDAPRALIHYARHCQTSVCVDDARHHELLRGDAYAKEHDARSLLCMPLLRQGQVLGFLVLENPLLCGAFGPDRQTFLGFVLSQAAISIENARLYTHLQESESRLRAVIGSMPGALVVVDPQGKPTIVNEEGQRLLDEGASHLLWKSSLERSLGGNAVRNEEIILPDPDSGRDARFCVSAAPVHDGGEHILGAVAVAQDVTELRELDRLKDQFLRVVAHELKTPLGIVSGYAELLERKISLEGTTGMLLSSIKSGASSLARLVDDLLDVSLLQLGRLQIRKQNFDLVELIRESCAQMGLTSARHALVFEPDCEALPVFADRLRLGQVLRNLIHNAIKYTPSGGNIEVGCRAGEDGARVWVRDPGVGIPEAKRERIFQCFFRAHTDTPYDFGGIGAGLFLSQRIVTLHGGQIGFDTVVNQGSSFYFTLPSVENE